MSCAESSVTKRSRHSRHGFKRHSTGHVVAMVASRNGTRFILYGLQRHSSHDHRGHARRELDAGCRFDFMAAPATWREGKRGDGCNHQRTTCGTRLLYGREERRKIRCTRVPLEMILLSCRKIYLHDKIQKAARLKHLRAGFGNLTYPSHRSR